MRDRITAFDIESPEEMHSTLTMVNMIVALESLNQVTARYNRSNTLSFQPPFHFSRFMFVIFCLSFTMTGCNSEPDIELPPTSETVINIGEPLAPDPSTTTVTDGTGLLHMNDGIETLDKLLKKHPNAEVLTGPQRHEITLNDGSKIRGEMIDIDNNGSVILKLDSGKKITIPSSDYTSVRILLDKKGGG